MRARPERHPMADAVDGLILRAEALCAKYRSKADGQAAAMSGSSAERGVKGRRMARLRLARASLHIVEERLAQLRRSRLTLEAGDRPMSDPGQPS